MGWVCGQGNCIGACSSACGTGCGNTCTGKCQGCAGTCIKGCAYNCTGDCSGSCLGGCNGCSGCSGSCDSACNIGCVNGAQTTVYNNLTLDIYFNASNINDISNFIYYNAQRFGGNPTVITKTSGNSLMASDISIIDTNLQMTGQSPAYSAITGENGLRVLGQDLIDKAKAAYNTVIGL